MREDNVGRNCDAAKAHRAKDAHIDTCGVARAGSLRSSSSAYALAESERRERPRRESNERLIYVFMKNKTVAPVHLLFETHVYCSAYICLFVEIHVNDDRCAESRGAEHYDRTPCA